MVLQLLSISSGIFANLQHANMLCSLLTQNNVGSKFITSLEHIIHIIGLHIHVGVNLVKQVWGAQSLVPLVFRSSSAHSRSKVGAQA